KGASMKRLPWIWLILWYSISLIALSDNDSFQLERSMQGPSGIAAPFGFDTFGRNLLTLGMRASLLSSLFSASSTLLTVILGILCGGILALLSSRGQFFALRVLDTVLAFPYLLIAIAWAAIWGPGWHTLF